MSFVQFTTNRRCLPDIPGDVNRAASRIILHRETEEDLKRLFAVVCANLVLIQAGKLPGNKTAFGIIQNGGEMLVGMAVHGATDDERRWLFCFAQELLSMFMSGGPKAMAAFDDRAGESPAGRFAADSWKALSSALSGPKGRECADIFRRRAKAFFNCLPELAEELDRVCVSASRVILNEYDHEDAARTAAFCLAAKETLDEKEPLAVLIRNTVEAILSRWSLNVEISTGVCVWESYRVLSKLSAEELREARIEALSSASQKMRKSRFWN